MQRDAGRRCLEQLNGALEALKEAMVVKQVIRRKVQSISFPRYESWNVVEPSSVGVGAVC